MMVFNTFVRICEICKNTKKIHNEDNRPLCKVMETINYIESMEVGD